MKNINTDGKQDITIWIKVEPNDQWEEWAVSGLYVLHKDDTATHLGGEKLPKLGEPNSKYK